MHKLKEKNDYYHIASLCKKDKKITKINSQGVEFNYFVTHLTSPVSSP